jgi:hypothetical protein
MEMMKTSDKEESLWLKAFCPESSCFQVQEGVDLSHLGSPESEDSASGAADLFDQIFCPEDSCEVYRYTDLP